MTIELDHIVGAIRPTFHEPHTDLRFSTPSFQIDVRGTRVTAYPRSGRAVPFASATTVLESDLAPYLAVVGADAGMPVELWGCTRFYRDTDDPTGSLQHDPVGTSIRLPFSIEGATWKADFAKRVGWAQTDPVYRGLCELLALAQDSINPRPHVFNMLERLEVKYGNRAAARKALNLGAKTIRLIAADQALYLGDRHADQPAGGGRVRLDEATRNACLEVADLLRQQYERIEFSTALKS